HEQATTAGVPDERPDGHRDHRRRAHREARVRETLTAARRQPDRTGPVVGGQEIRDRPLHEVHRAPPTTGPTIDRRRVGRAARSHGVISRPANRISTSMTIATANSAMMPARIWSLLSVWNPWVNQVPRPPMPITEPTETIAMLVTTTTRKPAIS